MRISTTSMVAILIESSGGSALVRLACWVEEGRTLCGSFYGCHLINCRELTCVTIKPPTFGELRRENTIDQWAWVVFMQSMRAIDGLRPELRLVLITGDSAVQEYSGFGVDRIMWLTPVPAQGFSGWWRPSLACQFMMVSLFRKVFPKRLKLRHNLVTFLPLVHEMAAKALRERAR